MSQCQDTDNKSLFKFSLFKIEKRKKKNPLPGVLPVPPGLSIVEDGFQ